jgi:RodZ C-terminal domain
VKDPGRVLFVVLCIIALALLVVTVLVVAGVGVKDKSSPPPSTRERSGGGTIAYAPTLEKQSTTTPAAATTSTSQPAPPNASPVVLVVTASRGDCWLEVRRGSETGLVRYAATLPLGQTVRFQGSRFWVRFGGASNVDVLFGGKPVAVPSGTVALVLSRPSRL